MITAESRSIIDRYLKSIIDLWESKLITDDEFRVFLKRADNLFEGDPELVLTTAAAPPKRDDDDLPF